MPVNPKYTIWESLGVAVSVASLALEEVRALASLTVKKAERGERGPPGRLPVVKEWTDRVHYEGDVVKSDGRTWQAIRDTGKPPETDDWLCIAERGANGKDGAGFAVRSTWSADQKYRALDVVALNGASFVARHDDPGQCPGEGWQMIAAQGKRGQPGERGLKGDKGDRGPAGQPVVSMSVDENALLTLTNADGSQVTCDLYPLLSRMDR